MRYYIIRHIDTEEVLALYSLEEGNMIGRSVEEISKSEYETYKEFGVPVDKEPFQCLIPLWKRKWKIQEQDKY